MTSSVHGKTNTYHKQPQQRGPSGINPAAALGYTTIVGAAYPPPSTVPTASLPVHPSPDTHTPLVPPKPLVEPIER